MGICASAYSYDSRFSPIIRKSEMKNKSNLDSKPNYRLDASASLKYIDDPTDSKNSTKPRQENSEKTITRNNRTNDSLESFSLKLEPKIEQKNISSKKTKKDLKREQIKFSISQLNKALQYYRNKKRLEASNGHKNLEEDKNDDINKILSKNLEERLPTIREVVYSSRNHIPSC